MFGHDEEHALGVAVDLVNTAPQTAGAEGLADPSDLHDLLEPHRLRYEGGLAAADLAAVRTLRDRLLAVFEASGEDDAAHLVNAIVASARATPRLVAHDGHVWHLHYFAPDATLAEQLAADCGMALARVVADAELDRLRRCDAADCDHVLVDLSRNRSKRYCDSKRCGNRVHVAAYRERRRAAADS